VSVVRVCADTGRSRGGSGGGGSGRVRVARQ